LQQVAPSAQQVPLQTPSTQIGQASTFAKQQNPTQPGAVPSVEPSGQTTIIVVTSGSEQQNWRLPTVRQVSPPPQQVSPHGSPQQTPPEQD